MDETARREMFVRRYHERDTPWDSGQTPPELSATALPLRPGRALDLGCGTGLNACALAAWGWEAIGVDYVAEAIARATERDCPGARFLVGDVSRLETLPIAGPFDLFLDIGCFHGLSEAQRRGYAAQVQRLAAPGARLLLYAALPRPDAEGGPRGIGADEVAARFAPAFRLERQELGHDGGGWATAWYWLRRPDVEPPA